MMREREVVWGIVRIEVRLEFGYVYKCIFVFGCNIKDIYMVFGIYVKYFKSIGKLLKV